MPDQNHASAAPRWMAACAGMVSAGIALAVGELVCGLLHSGPSLVSAVGTEFIDRFAASLKSLAVSLFGTSDKAALVVGIVVISLGLGALFGMAARTRFWVGATGFAAFGALGSWAYLRHPGGDPATGVLAAVLAVAAGIGALAFLLRMASPQQPAASPSRADAAAVVDGVATGRDVAAAQLAPAGPGAASRRTFLVASAALGIGAAATAALGRRARGPGVTAVRDRVVLPAPDLRVSGVDSSSLPVPGLSPFVTPNDDFYRIDTALTVPQVDVTSWRLDVSGLVERPYSITFDELLRMDSVEETVTLQCVSNEVGGDLVGNAVWQGVPLRSLLELAGVTPGASQVVGRSVDRWTAGFPTELVGDGRVAMVAYAMNGEALPVQHGFPARLVVSGLYGYVSATKWLRQIELTRWDAFDGYWVPRGWAKDGPIKTMSRIDVPSAGATLPAGRSVVAGVAWAPPRGVERVEVQVDEGAWRACALGPNGSAHTWVQWRAPWDAMPGEHVLRVRASDGDEVTQTPEVHGPQPDGATGWHARRVRVEAPA